MDKYCHRPVDSRRIKFKAPGEDSDQTAHSFAQSDQNLRWAQLG